jgi:hypothetical protein
MTQDRGNAYALSADETPLPRMLEQANERFTRSDFARECYLEKEFRGQRCD